MSERRPRGNEMYTQPKLLQLTVTKSLDQTDRYIYSLRQKTSWLLTAHVSSTSHIYTVITDADDGLTQRQVSYSAR